jgi:hypothetical protein
MKTNLYQYQASVEICTASAQRHSGRECAHSRTNSSPEEEVREGEEVVAKFAVHLALHTPAERGGGGRKRERERESERERERKKKRDRQKDYRIIY